MLVRIQEMAETTKPYDMMQQKKTEGLEQVNNDQFEVVNFENHRVHFFTSLSHYRFIIFGKRDSLVGANIFLKLYDLLVQNFLKKPDYDAVPFAHPGPPACAQRRQVQRRDPEDVKRHLE